MMLEHLEFANALMIVDMY